MKQKFWPLALIVVLITACGRPADQAQATYETVAVSKRDIRVAVEAAGQIEPALTVELKSKASGQILELKAETGQLVEEGTLLVQIDKRNPRNSLAQAQAQLEAAKARRAIAEAQNKRAAALLAERIINEVDYEQSQLELANARADVVRSNVAVETARIQLDDTDLRAPITGTIIEKLVEEGQVISSPTMDVGGGTLLLKMADLSSVQVRTLVDETDIGKITPGLPAVVTVTAFPNQPFTGTVLKVEPQASADQTVTTFAVRIMLGNESGLLKPGMNADVAILITERKGVLAVPTNALRTDRDLATSASLVGLSEDAAREQLRENALPDEPGDTAGAGSAYRFSNRYWVFVQRDGKPVAVEVKTGVTDLDYSEVLAGLRESEHVYMLPSSGLVESQQRLQQQMRKFTGMPGMSGSK
ncbi:MAG: efflux RND transporter periplasmic adaptor subunit [Gammaproteobacteria bacterium]